MKSRVATDSLRRLCRALLLRSMLPLLLLCAQQGAFLHELGHYKPAQSQDEDHKQDSGGPCALCLAYAGVESAVSPASPPPLLLTGLSFALMAVVATFARAATAPAQRNRGPPDLR
jgi:hypothetical protein